jgi:hypothetical protein
MPSAFRGINSFMCTGMADGRVIAGRSVGSRAALCCAPMAGCRDSSLAWAIGTSAIMVSLSASVHAGDWTVRGRANVPPPPWSVAC